VYGKAPDRSSGSEARADDHIVAVVGKGDHLRQKRRIMLKIGVHLKNQVRPPRLDRVGNTSHIGIAKAAPFSGKQMEIGIATLLKLA
jgi:hypothetical protein